MLDNLPSIGKMFKLIIVLILALIAIGLVLAIVKVMLPLLLLAAIIAGGVYLFNKMQANGSAKAKRS